MSTNRRRRPSTLDSGRGLIGAVRITKNNRVDWRGDAFRDPRCNPHCHHRPLDNTPRRPQVGVDAINHKKLHEERTRTKHTEVNDVCTQSDYFYYIRRRSPRDYCTYIFSVSESVDNTNGKTIGAAASPVSGPGHISAHALRRLRYKDSKCIH